MRAPVHGTSSPQTTTAVAALSVMSLAELRAYRQDLLAEDDRVSYWRRLVHARLDLQRAGEAQDGPLDVQQIAAALRATGAGTRRRVFSPIVSQEPLPHMPALKRFWDQSDPTEDLGSSLVEVEDQLSDYRRAVHSRLDEATAELVDRYRQTPAEAVALLPEAEQ